MSKQETAIPTFASNGSRELVRLGDEVEFKPASGIETVGIVVGFEDVTWQTYQTPKGRPYRIARTLVVDVDVDGETLTIAAKECF